MTERGEEIIERVAEAISRSAMAEHDYEDTAYAASVALLDAIREPSETMINRGYGPHESDDEPPTQVWYAMLDALKREIEE